ncbi:hypothetical protein SAMN05421664_2536 [Chryseobacterium soldanellicola]|uniref:Uncharacterized protein n=1 Tax=Chryseobacterium soldanellicola TaxID=311333 RepID=A0A1H1DLE4_9FLAO|nr:hypothetical protein [Chryseobacterium soldanellicola]SDQ77273.1 hypothetical protein SAMN05421664_2536 [Chryseobacterium soldanellicola]
MMNATAEILQHKIESFSPDLLETLAKMVENLEMQNKYSVPQFQIDEVLYRIEFHRENPKTKLDFYENVSELEKSFA